MRNNLLKLKTLKRVFGPELLSVYVVLVCVLLMSTATFAFWTQTVTQENDIVLQAESVTYLVSYLSPDNAGALFTPPIAVKDSLKNNNIVIETPASVVERVIAFRLMGKTVCNLYIYLDLYYLDAQQNYLELPAGIMDVELWCLPDIAAAETMYLLTYDQQINGYFIENFPYDQAATLTIKISLAVVDELLDPVYKGTDFKMSVAFAAEKTEGVP